MGNGPRSTPDPVGVDADAHARGVEAAVAALDAHARAYLGAVHAEDGSLAQLRHEVMLLAAVRRT